MDTLLFATTNLNKAKEVEKGGKHEYYTTGDPIKFMKIAQKWMHDPTLKAQHVE